MRQRCRTRSRCTTWRSTGGACRTCRTICTARPTRNAPGPSCSRCTRQRSHKRRGVEADLQVGLHDEVIDMKSGLVFGLGIFASVSLLAQTPYTPAHLQAPRDPGYAALIATCKTPPPAAAPRGGG